MRAILLSEASVIHTVRWANALSEAGIRIHLLSLGEPIEPLSGDIDLQILKGKRPWGYFFAIGQVKSLIKEISPDVVNAHYATGYGTLARLANAKPLLLSVWGSDVYDFPEKSVVHRKLVKRNIEFADAVASTSVAMANRVQAWSRPNKVFITPFGVDEERFFPTDKDDYENGERLITIGTVKTLTRKYGIDTMIKAFAVLMDRLRDKRHLGSSVRLRLRIVGKGYQDRELRDLCRALKISEFVDFVGSVPHSEVPSELHKLDIYVALSRLDSESFGVAVLEASACEKPVIVSDADGPKEVTLHNVTGIVVPRESPEAAAEAMWKLICDLELRKRMGRNGRRHVLENYTWKKSVNAMVNAYSKTVVADQ